MSARASVLFPYEILGRTLLLMRNLFKEKQGNYSGAYGYITGWIALALRTITILVPLESSVEIRLGLLWHVVNRTDVDNNPL